jgi:hypothetical protein
MNKEDAIVYLEEIYEFLCDNYEEYAVPDQWIKAIERVMEEL